MTNTQEPKSQKRSILNILKPLKSIIEIVWFIPKFDYYQYNYQFLSPLAVTNVCELPISGIPQFPKSAFPSIEWIVLLLLELFKLYLWHTVNTLKSKIKLNIELSEKPKLEGTLKKIQSFAEKFIHQIQDERIDNIDIASDLFNFLQEIDQELARYDGFNSLFESTSTKSPEQPQQILKELLNYYINYIKLIEELPENSENNNQSSQILDNGLQYYDNLYNLIIKQPVISQYFQQDKYFAYMQVAGPNPLMLQQVKKPEQLLSITSEQYEQITAITMGKSDSLEMAMKEGRLYLSDYSKLESLRHGSFPEAQKYIYAPSVLFAVPPVSNSSRNLTPVAIRCQQILFTPLEQGTWMTAKSIVQMADSNYHELISHLAHTHLFIEPFIVATHHLPVTHPVRQILLPHFQGTVLINYGAHKFLIAPKGGVDQLLASTIQTDQQLAIKTAQEKLFNFNNCALPDDLERRSVHDASKLPIYPYRDDGLLIWDAIHRWVKAYFSCYYSSDYQVLYDMDLQTWATELISEYGGRIKNFGQDGKIRTLDYLVKAITIIIFTASAQHAAVNFPQGNLMTYVPAFPLARYTSAPTTAEQKDNFINGLPPLNQAEAQIRLLQILGSIYYTRLGNYGDCYFQSAPAVQSALNDFQKDLKEVESKIAKHNQDIEIRKEIPYEYLSPPNIPQSINI